MAGISVDAGGGAKRAVNSELNMVPMIDLLMVTISFLLITAVWTTMSRIESNAQVPGQRDDRPPTEAPPQKQLHVQMRSADHFQLVWKQGTTVLSQRDVPRHDKPIEKKGTKLLQLPELAAEVQKDWVANGAHRDASDTSFDTAVVHTNDETPYYQVVAVMDAVSATQRPFHAGGKAETVPAFNITFSTQ